VRRIVFTNSQDETESEGARLAASLWDGAVVALSGELGAGKTAFVRGIAAGLGCEAGVTSPTFTIVNEYPGPTPLFHFDMYRLADERELFDIGWDDYLGRGGVIAAEWSENTPRAFPEDSVRVSITRAGDQARKIEITGGRGAADGSDWGDARA
jgi:tRNA threonylcarbamoyladenosine biosynthesis protein TsaE